ncbi:oligosaccharide flippase family protein [Spongiibacter marinus]|uniref:oligosaccharide flippase family protein n=1 Tax=Spongiibacter marinus TaxID=354246 RepID=UPI00040EDA19|nr:oligosaccharide flippase family protein [Spongiibacter marinus]
MSAGNSFIKSLSWLATGELMVRVSRLLTTLILARYLSLQDYGIAALAVASAEIVRILAANGVGNLILKAEQAKLTIVTQTVFWLNLAIGVVMFGLQFFAAPLIAELYNAPVLESLLKALSFSHLIYPFAMVQFNLLQRDSRMKEAGLIMGATVTLDNILCAVLALSGFGVWSVIWPKLFAAALWVAVINRRVPWLPRFQFSWRELRKARRYSGGVLLAECLKNGRNQFDMFILGRLLPADMFGLYAFARNAGLGISLSLTNGFNTALLPKLCDARRAGEALGKSYFSSLLTAMKFIAPLILCQALLAPVYVPLLFGQQWAPASMLIVALCLSAIPRMVFESASMYFRAADQLRSENQAAMVFTIMFCLVIAAVSVLGAQAVALAMIACYVVGAGLLLIVISRSERVDVNAELAAG